MLGKIDVWRSASRVARFLFEYLELRSTKRASFLTRFSEGDPRKIETRTRRINGNIDNLRAATDSSEILRKREHDRREELGGEDDNLPRVKNEFSPSRISSSIWPKYKRIAALAALDIPSR